MSNEYSGIGNLEAMQVAENYNNYIIQKIKSAAGSSNANLLDFGAGNGTIAIRLVQSGFSVDCVEQDQELIRTLAKEELVVFSTLDNIGDASRKFIYSLNVLEHIENDKLVASELVKKLSPGGTILIYVPAFTILWSSMDTAVGHYRRYDKKSLTNLFKSEDLEILKLEYIDSLGFLASLVLKAFGTKDGRLSPILVKAYDRLIFPLSKMLDRARLPFGKNVLLVARLKDSSI
jgi:SAM-dependent methyltransferase